MKVLVIGGSGFIGQEVIKSLKANDHEVIGTYFNNKKDNCELKLDIMNNQDIQNLADISQLDSIIFCHSAFEKEVLTLAQDKECHTQFEYMNMDLNKKIIDAHGVQSLSILQILLPKLKASKNANIIFLGSLVGQKAAIAPLGYTLSKSFTVGFLSSLSKELGEFNIKVNSINPGVLKGGISQYLKENALRDYMKHTALKRFGEPNEVANIASWIVSKNTYITGQPFLIDGGL